MNDKPSDITLDKLMDVAKAFSEKQNPSHPVQSEDYVTNKSSKHPLFEIYKIRQEKLGRKVTILEDIPSLEEMEIRMSIQTSLNARMKKVKYGL